MVIYEALYYVRNMHWEYAFLISDLYIPYKHGQLRRITYVSYGMGIRPHAYLLQV